MNEELRIIIRAVADEAQRNLASVREELEKIQSTSGESGKVVNKALSGFAKGAAAAVAAITALTAAMKSLGQAAVNVQKSFAKLNTTFMNAGSTTKQASQTYQELFAFLGDHEKAVETAQSLALITSEEAKLAEWTYTLQGAFAEMGDKLPIEGLAEAANETIKVGQVVGVLADALNWAGVNEDAFNQALAQTTSLSEREALVRSTLNGLYGNSAKIYSQTNQATIRYNDSQARLNLTLASAASYTTPLLTSLNELSVTLLTSFGPALETIAVYLTAFIQLLAEAAAWVGSFFGMFDGGSENAVADIDGYRAAVKAYQEALRNSLNGTNGELKEELENINAIKKATMGFDELNIVSKPASAPSIGGGGSIGGGSIGGGGGSLPAAPNPEDFGIGMGSMDMSAFNASVEEASSKLSVILTIVSTIGAGILAWKFVDKISDIIQLVKQTKGLKGVVDGLSGSSTFFGKIFRKAAEEAYGEHKKQLDDITNKWKTLIGNALIMAGATIAILGYSDAWVNGIDWGNFAAVLGGIALVVAGLALKFGTLGAGVGLAVGGIFALVLGIKDLVTNGYSMEAVLMVLAGALGVGIGLILIFNAALLANPITWIVIAIAALVAAFVVLWNECDAFRQFWIDLWNGIVDAFWAVVDWIKNAFNSIVNFFKDNWQTILGFITNPFGAAFKLLYDNCDAFREFIDKWVGKIKNFFVGLWEGIKNVFSGIGAWFANMWDGVVKIFSKVGTAIGDAISNTVKGAINWILDKAVGMINGFIKGINWAIDVINLIPGVNIKTLSLLEVPKLATGGITNGATMAMIGEAGKEAVLPLENNTGWMDSLADRIASRNATPTKIVLQLDGKELGWANINSINSITKQTGTLQLVMA